MAKKRAFIAEIIRKLTEIQRNGEVVSWPKISFVASESEVLRGSQLWESLGVDFEADLSVEPTRSKRTHEALPYKTKSKPSVVSRLKKGQTSEWEFTECEEDDDYLEETMGRGNRGRGMRGRGNRGRGKGKGRRGDCNKERRERASVRGLGSSSRGRGGTSSLKGDGGRISLHEAVEGNHKTVTERSKEQMNDVLLRLSNDFSKATNHQLGVASTGEKDLGKGRRGKGSQSGMKMPRRQQIIEKKTRAGVWIDDSNNDFKGPTLDSSLSDIRVGLTFCLLKIVLFVLCFISLAFISIT